MGAKTSRHGQQHETNVSSTNAHDYPINARAYATWNHGVALTSNDVPRVVNHEMKHLRKHNRTTTTTAAVSTSPICYQQEAMKKIKSTNHFVEQSRTPYVDRKPNVKLALRKSQSVDNLFDRTNVVTTQQLLNDQAKRRSRKQSSSSQISQNSFQSSVFDKSGSSTSINRTTTSSKTKRKKVPDDSKFVLINSNDIKNVREIGKGNFGTVYQGSYKGKLDVAIKSLHGQDENSRRENDHEYDKNLHDLLNEAHIMTRLKHRNLLRIIGVTFLGDRQQLSLVTDYMKNGSLLNYLKKNRDLFFRSDVGYVTNKLNSFSRQIFEGMSYLEERKIIHRDLAARNCLIGKDETLKVGDFGLTTLTECGLYKATYQTICAPRWTAPEAVFSQKYSSRSDVWSYGITLWEIYSLGERPFGNMTNVAVQFVLKNASENLSRYLPQSQQFGSNETYTHIILPCLTYNLSMRPRFKDLRERILTILVDST